MGKNKRLPWWALRCRYHVWREVRRFPWSSSFATGPLYRWMGSNRFGGAPDRPWSHAVFNHLFLKLAQSRPNLEEMVLHWCPRDLDILTSFSKLTQLSIARGEGVDASGLANLPQLEQVQLTCWPDLETLAGLDALDGLKCLRILDCRRLTSVAGLPTGKQAQSYRAPAGQQVPPLKLSLIECSALESLDGLQHVSQLRSLELSNCKNLKSIDALAEATQLSELKVWRCPAIEGVTCLADLPNLTIDYRGSGWKKAIVPDTVAAKVGHISHAFFRQ